MSQTFLEDIPEFLEIQRNSFLRILDIGLIQAFEKINPIVPTSQCQYGLLFYPKEYVLILPENTITEAFLQGKTYGCKIYVPAVIYNIENSVNLPRLAGRRFKSLKTYRLTKTTSSRFLEETFFGSQESGYKVSPKLAIEMKRSKAISKKGNFSRIMGWECFFPMLLAMQSLSKKNKVLAGRWPLGQSTGRLVSTASQLKTKNLLVLNEDGLKVTPQGKCKDLKQNTFSKNRETKLWNIISKLSNTLGCEANESLFSKNSLLTKPNLIKSKILKFTDQNVYPTPLKPSKQTLKPTLHYLLKKVYEKKNQSLVLNFKIAQCMSIQKQSCIQKAAKDDLGQLAATKKNVSQILKQNFLERNKLVLYETLPKTIRQKSKFGFFQKMPSWLRGRSNNSLIHEARNRLQKVLYPKGDKGQEAGDFLKLRDEKRASKEWLLPFSKGSLINPLNTKIYGSQEANLNFFDLQEPMLYKNNNFNLSLDSSLANLSSFAKPISRKEWVCIGVLPLMTPRGHFIINGSHRIIISQMARAPGLYYQAGDKVQATIVPSKGAWLRLSVKASENGEIKIWVRITPQRKMPYKIFIETYKNLESKKAISSKGGFKFLNLAYKTLNSKIKHLDKQYAVGVVSGQINRTLLNPSSYSLGTLGRKRLNERLGINEKKGYLTSKDISLIKDSLLKLLGQKSSDLSADDIDHLENRRVRTCGELLQAEIETGMARLKKAIGKQLDEYSNPDSSLFNTFKSQAIGNKNNNSINSHVYTKQTKGANELCFSFQESLPISFNNPSYQQNPSLVNLVNTGNTVQTTKNIINFFWLKTLNQQNWELYTATPDQTLVLFKQKKSGFFWKKNKSLLFLKKKLFALLTLHSSLEIQNRPVPSAKPIGRLWVTKGQNPQNQQQKIGITLAQARLGREVSNFLPPLKKAGYASMTSLPLLGGYGSEPEHGEAFQMSPPCIAPPRHARRATKGDEGQPGGNTGKETSSGHTQKRATKGFTEGTALSKDMPFMQSNKDNQNQKNNFSEDRVLPNVSFTKKKSVSKMETKNQYNLLSPSKIIGTKAFAGALREFFGSNPLSQYMDQTNPLAEITHKRRLSSLGPGGVDRASAGIAIRGIHPSHYGRICPIETPEGKNAGLVNSMTMWARVNNDGFLETPYFIVKGGSLMSHTNNLIPHWNFLPTKRESQQALKIVSSDLKITQTAFLPSIALPTRDGSERSFGRKKRDSVDFCGISPMQNISVATSLIPFLEHDDATRALMGSNMQRQAVPLLKAKEPLIRTGLEGKVVGESGHALQASCSGIISTATRTFIAIDSFDIIKKRIVAAGAKPNLSYQAKNSALYYSPNLKAKHNDTSSSSKLLSREYPKIFANALPVSTLASPILENITNEALLAKPYYQSVSMATLISCIAVPLTMPFGGQRATPGKQGQGHYGHSPEQTEQQGRGGALLIRRGPRRTRFSIALEHDKANSWPKNQKYIGNIRKLPFLKNKSLQGSSKYGLDSSLSAFLAPKPISSLFYIINYCFKGFVKGWLNTSCRLGLFDNILQKQVKALLEQQPQKLNTSFMPFFSALQALGLRRCPEGYTKPKAWASLSENTMSMPLALHSPLLPERLCLGGQGQKQQGLVSHTKASFSPIKQSYTFLESRAQCRAESRPNWAVNAGVFAQLQSLEVKKLNSKKLEGLTSNAKHMFARPNFEAFAQEEAFKSPCTVALLNLAHRAVLTLPRKQSKHINQNKQQVIPKTLWRENSKIKRHRKIHDLQQYARSNQATVCVQRPAVTEGRWVQKGDLIGDCSASKNGVLALGQNIVVAYLPMEGFNFEDAIVVSDRLVHEELYTSIHVQRVEFDMDALVKKHIPRKIKVKKQKSAYKTSNQDWITLNNPHLLESEKQNLNPLGIINVGSWVGPGDVLVSKVFPVDRKIAPSRHLLAAVYQEKKTKILDTDDTSVRVPKGIHGRVINVKIVGVGKTASLPLLQSILALSQKKKDQSTYFSILCETNSAIKSSFSRTALNSSFNIENTKRLDEIKTPLLKQPPQCNEVSVYSSCVPLSKEDTNPVQTNVSHVLSSSDRQQQEINPTLGHAHSGSLLHSPSVDGERGSTMKDTHDLKNWHITKVGSPFFCLNYQARKIRITKSLVLAGATVFKQHFIFDFGSSELVQTQQYKQVHPNTGYSSDFQLERAKKIPTLSVDSTVTTLAMYDKLAKQKALQTPISSSSNLLSYFPGLTDNKIFFANLQAKEQAPIIAIQGLSFKLININSSFITNASPSLVRRVFFHELINHVTPINQMLVNCQGPYYPLGQQLNFGDDNTFIGTLQSKNPSQKLTIEQNNLSNSFFVEKTDKAKKGFLPPKEKSQERVQHSLVQQERLPQGHILPKKNNGTRFSRLKGNDLFHKSINTQEYKITGVRIYIAERKKLQVGDKMSGRHGNKGIVSTILPREDMPYLPDGTPVDMVLNPLGIPSRMNVGQVFECLLGLAASVCGESIGHTPFDEMYGPEASRSLVYLFLYVSRLRSHADWIFQPNFPGKTLLFDGRTGTPFEQWVTVGRAYMLKLIHMVDEKIHARSIGPRSLVTQQPVKGRARGGGQRLGEMEVWALEGFGAAYTLQEILTIKSDDIKGREDVESSIISATSLSAHIPETFRITLFELRCLCLNLELNQNF